MKEKRKENFIKGAVVIMILLVIMIMGVSCFKKEEIEEVVVVEKIPSHSDYKDIEIFDDVNRYNGLTLEEIIEIRGSKGEDDYDKFFNINDERGSFYFEFEKYKDKVSSVYYNFRSYFECGEDPYELFYRFGIEPDYSTLELSFDFVNGERYYINVNEEIKGFYIDVKEREDEFGNVIYRGIDRVRVDFN